MEKKRSINNEFYDALGSEWMEREDHPIALLRAENKVRNPWIVQTLQKTVGSSGTVLDIGCGAGLLTNHLAKEGYLVTGIDLSSQSLQIAAKHDTTQSASYLQAHAYCLPFENESFDAVCAMDVLEHVEDPHLLIAEASRVLKTGGLFFFHTFNRNLLSYFLIIKGVDWFIPNAPKDMHVYPLFIKPDELKEQCAAYKLEVVDLKGLQPKIFTQAAVKLLATRKVPADFAFQFTKSLATGYCGIALKQATY